MGQKNKKHGSRCECSIPKAVARMENAEVERILRNVFCGKELMDCEADSLRSVLAEGICKDPEKLDEAVVTLSEASSFLNHMLEDMKCSYDEEGDHDEEDAYYYAHNFLVIHAIIGFLDSVAKNETDYYLHLCDLGCAAVRKIKQQEMKEEREHYGYDHKQKTAPCPAARSSGSGYMR